MESSTHVANELAKDQDGVSQVQRPLSSERAERDFVVEVNKEHEPRDPSLTALPDDSRNLVTWGGPDDTENPKNWSFAARWRITATFSAFTFISCVSTSMTAPALETIGRNLKIDRAFEQSLILSIFILAYPFGQFLFGPLSELYGRCPVLHISNLVYLACNTACGFAKTGPQMMACRFFAGFGGSTAMVIGAGVLSDVWEIEERGLALDIYTLVTLASPTVGPLLGGFITQYSSWRWTFWSISILGGCVQLAATLFLRETFPPVLLGRKADKMRKETGDRDLRTKWEGPDRTFRKVARTGLARPCILLTTQPILQCLAVYGAYIYGVYILALTTFPILWTQVYHQSISIAGLHYLALALGYIIGSTTCTRLTDFVYLRLKETRGRGAGRPEYRLPLLVPGALLVPIGLLWYGWSAQRHLHWIMPDIGIVIFGAGVKYCLQCTQLYGLDVYPTWTASAHAGAQFVKSLTGFAFPLYAPYLYQKLGFGWGNSLLALVATLIGVPVPFLLWRYGPALRKRSPYAAGD